MSINGFRMIDTEECRNTEFMRAGISYFRIVYDVNTNWTSTSRTILSFDLYTCSSEGIPQPIYSLGRDNGMT